MNSILLHLEKGVELFRISLFPTLNISKLMDGNLSNKIYLPYSGKLQRHPKTSHLYILCPFEVSLQQKHVIFLKEYCYTA